MGWTGDPLRLTKASAVLSGGNERETENGYQGPLMMELTGASVKVRRTVPQLRDYPLDKEVIFSASYLNFLLKQQAVSREN